MIDEVTSGSLAKNGKLNEVIRYLNSIINTHVEISELGDGSPDRRGFHITQDQSLLVIPEAEEGGGGAGADGFEIIWKTAHLAIIHLPMPWRITTHQVTGLLCSQYLAAHLPRAYLITQAQASMMQRATRRQFTGCA